jgi:hypothetical protein
MLEKLLVVPTSIQDICLEVRAKPRSRKAANFEARLSTHAGGNRHAEENYRWTRT